MKITKTKEDQAVALAQKINTLIQKEQTDVFAALVGLMIVTGFAIEQIKKILPEDELKELIIQVHNSIDSNVAYDSSATSKE